MNVMPISEIIEKVTMICKKNNVKRLDLFGSFATGTATPTSDIDFVVYGCDNLMQLEDDLLQIETLRKIDIFDFDSIKNEYLLEDINSNTADPKTDFVLEGTVLNFSLTFDISWKVMKDILIKKMGILDFAVGSPRETLQQAFTNGIIDDDTWLQMLKSRNHLSHDYDGTFAAEKFQDIINIYYPLFEKFKNDVAKYYKQ